MSRKIALLFAGQGAQVVGMGKDLAKDFVEAADLFQRADEALGRNLSEIGQSLSIAETQVVRLEPEEWHKWNLLQAETAAIRLLDYFRERGYSSARIVSSPATERFNASLLERSEESFASRLKLARPQRVGACPIPISFPEATHSRGRPFAR